MTGKEAWSVISPLLGCNIEKNPVTLDAYGTTYAALVQYDKEKIGKMCQAEAMEFEEEEAEKSGIGKRIEEILQSNGISQRELADKCKITEVSMSRYIRGQRVPKATVIATIADALNVSADYLLGGNEVEE